MGAHVKYHFGGLHIYSFRRIIVLQKWLNVSPLALTEHLLARNGISDANVHTLCLTYDAKVMNCCIYKSLCKSCSCNS
jgi:hypothetical protein